MNVKVGDKIGIIHKHQPMDGTDWGYKLLTSKITAIHIGKHATMACSKDFRPIDVDDLESNTMWLDKIPTVLLVEEPFLCTSYLQERAENWVEREGWRDDER